MANTPFRLSATPPHIRWSGPDLGAHNEQVYERIGIGADELAKLRAEGVV
jgi:formyl-CoA transferase